MLNLTIVLRTWILQSGESLHKLKDEEYWISCNESSHIIFEQMESEEGKPELDELDLGCLIHIFFIVHCGFSNMLGV